MDINLKNGEDDESEIIKLLDKCKYMIKIPLKVQKNQLCEKKQVFHQNQKKLQLFVDTILGLLKVLHDMDHGSWIIYKKWSRDVKKIKSYIKRSQSYITLSIVILTSTISSTSLNIINTNFAIK